jgi:hypothetical protein
MTIDTSTFTLPGADDWPSQLDPCPSATRQLTGLTEAQYVVLAEHLVQLQAEEAEREAARQRWQPCFDELAEVEENDGGVAMAEHLLERSRLCGWNETEDQRLRVLTCSLAEVLRLELYRDRRTQEVLARPYRGPAVRRSES